MESSSPVYDSKLEAKGRNEMNYDQKYHGLIDLVHRREKEVRDFIRFLEEETSWLSSPASTRFHLDIQGGLLRHSVSVAETLLKIKGILAPGIDNESCVIVGVFHDVGKVGVAGKSYYLPNHDKEDARKNGRKYIVNPRVVPMGLAVRSLFLVSQFIPLTEEEVQAIVYHDGQYILENRVIAHREEPLTLLLSYCDNWVGRILENKDGCYRHLIRERRL
jgi:hypothetical protein